MVVLEQSDYERLADALVAGYFNGMPLNDGILKVATDMGLNPNQVKQLVWSANTKAHLALFEKQANDKVIEFPVADADYILKRIYTPAEEQTLMDSGSTDKTAADFFSPIEVAQEKTAECVPFAVEAPPVSLKTAAARHDKAVRTLQKAKDELTFKVAEARETYVQQLYNLAWELRKQGYPEDFEKEAYARYVGTDVLPILNDLRSVYKREALTQEKVASEVDLIVDTRSANHRQFNELRNTYLEAIKLATSLQWVNSQFKDKIK